MTIDIEINRKPYCIIADAASIEAPNGRLIVLAGENRIYDAIALPGDTDETLLEKGRRIADNHAGRN